MLLSTGRLPALLIAIGAGIVLYGFLVTNDYDVRDVVIHGSDYTDAAEIAARSDLLGRSIFRLDPQLAADRLAVDPAIERVEVQLEFPARARVIIREREPVMIWHTGRDAVLVDDSGVVLGPEDGRELPAVNAVGATPAPGDMVFIDIVQAIRAIGPALGDAKLSVSEQQLIEAELADGRTISFGFPDRVHEKLAVLRSLLPEIGDDWVTMDLSRPERPAYR